AASERDLDILTLVAQGMSTTDIAASLHLSQHTVKDHLRRMSARWGCKGRANLVSTGYRLGYLKIVRGSV
ncbi:MAG TPA: helix-turn-helix transcriptional regulator, partial [Mycobacteriales bacterium]